MWAGFSRYAGERRNENEMATTISSRGHSILRGLLKMSIPKTVYLPFLHIGW